MTDMETDKQQVATVAVTITRDAMTILPRVVPKHELPILHAVFGEDNVQVADDQAEAVPVEIDVLGEVARLENKYGPGALEKAHGTAYKGAIGRELKEHIVQPEAEAATRKSKRAEAA